MNKHTIYSITLYRATTDNRWYCAPGQQPVDGKTSVFLCPEFDEHFNVESCLEVTLEVTDDESSLDKGFLLLGTLDPNKEQTEFDTLYYLDDNDEPIDLHRQASKWLRRTGLETVYWRLIPAT